MPILTKSRATSRLAASLACLSLFLSPRVVEAQGSGIEPLLLEPLPVDVPLSSIRWAIRAGNGRFVFGDTRAGIVYVRDADGSARILGSQGDGPGEYRYPTVGYLRGDSVIIHEVGHGRREAINLTTGRGTSRLLVTDPIGLRCRVVLLLSDTGVCEETEIGEQGSGTNTVISRWFRIGESDYTWKVMQTAEDSSYVGRLVHSAGVIHAARPYTWGNQSGISPNGAYGVVMTQAPAGDQARTTVSMWSIVDGQVTRMSRLAPVIPVSRSERNTLVSRRIEVLGSYRPQLLRERSGFEAALDRAWNLGPVAPPYKGIMVSNDRCVWLERTEVGVPSDSPARIYDRWTFSGYRLPTVSEPRMVRLVSVGCRTAVGVRHDEDGVPELTLLTVP